MVKLEVQIWKMWDDLKRRARFDETHIESNVNHGQALSTKVWVLLRTVHGHTTDGATSNDLSPSS
jgi:hypothetical protein